MPYLINGQPLPEEWIREEEQRLGRDLRFNAIADEAGRVRQLRIAAQHSAIDRMLVEQAAAEDPRPIDPQAVEQEVQRQKQAGNGRTASDDSLLRQWVERQFRLQRTHAEMVAGAVQPAAQEVEAFYEANRENFRNPELFQAAHIVKHVNREHSAEEARAGIEAALAELERGQPFAEVAERHSDCEGNGGDLGRFPAGQMVQEFEDAIRALEPGQRTGIFSTPLGFHIAELRARIAAGPATFEEVRVVIERVLALQNQHQVYLRAVAELRSRADIRWEARLPPPVAQTLGVPSESGSVTVGERERFSHNSPKPSSTRACVTVRMHACSHPRSADGARTEPGRQRAADGGDSQGAGPFPVRCARRLLPSGGLARGRSAGCRCPYRTLPGALASQRKGRLAHSRIRPGAKHTAGAHLRHARESLWSTRGARGRFRGSAFQPAGRPGAVAGRVPAWLAHHRSLG